MNKKDINKFVDVLANQALQLQVATIMRESLIMICEGLEPYKLTRAEKASLLCSYFEQVACGVSEMDIHKEGNK